MKNIFVTFGWNGCMTWASNEPNPSTYHIDQTYSRGLLRGRPGEPPPVRRGQAACPDQEVGPVRPGRPHGERRAQVPQRQADLLHQGREEEVSRAAGATARDDRRTGGDDSQGTGNCIFGLLFSVTVSYGRHSAVLSHKFQKFSADKIKLSRA